VPVAVEPEPGRRGRDGNGRPLASVPAAGSGSGSTATGAFEHDLALLIDRLAELRP